MSYRDGIRARQAVKNQQVRNLGVNVEDIRKESRSTQAVGTMLSRTINESFPTEGHERLYSDDFAGGTFDGTNQDFTLTRRVLGQNIRVWQVIQNVGTLQPLTRTSNPAPSAGQFYFDGLTLVRVGTPPAALDGLLAAFVTAL